MKIANKMIFMKQLTSIKLTVTTLLMSIAVVFSPVSISSAYAETKMMRVYTKFSDKEIVDLLKENFNVTIRDKGAIVVKDKGRNFTMLIDNKRDSGSLSFSFIFDKVPSYKVLNEWNMDKRFLRAFDLDGYLVLQNDLDVEYGISEEYLVKHVSSLFLLLLLNGKELTE